MTKVTLSNITNISGAESTALAAMNLNSNRIVAAMENTLSRDGTTPNQMGADIDMNNNDIYNVDNLVARTLVLNGTTLQPGVDIASALKIDNNLSDLSNTTTAKKNLGIYPTTVVRVEKFAYDLGITIASQDITPACVAAATYSAANPHVTIVFDGIYLFKSHWNCTQSGVKFHFDDAYFKVDDSAPMVSSAFGLGSGRMAARFTGSNSTFSGTATFEGQGLATLPGISGATKLAGIVFDTVTNIDAHRMLWKFKRLADCFIPFICTDCNFGDFEGTDIWGSQAFDGNPLSTAGTLVNPLSNVRCHFGRIHADNIHKPIVYCSVGGGTFGVGGITDNTDCTFGLITGTALASSIESNALALRSAVNCTFMGLDVSGFVCGFGVTYYAGSEAFSVDKTYVGFVRSINSNHVGLTDTAVQVLRATGTGTIGTVTIGHVEGDNIKDYGIFVNNTKLLVIKSANLNMAGNATAGRGIFGDSSRIEFGEINVTNTTYDAFLRGGTLTGFIRRLAQHTGTVAAGQTMVRDAATVAVDFTIDDLVYNQNGVGNNLTNLLTSTVSNSRQLRVNNTHGAGSAGALRFIDANYMTANWGVYSRLVTLTSAASLAVAANKSQTIAWTGVALGDIVTFSNLVATQAGSWAMRGDSPSTDNVIFIATNVATAAQTFPTCTNATVSVKHVN